MEDFPKKNIYGSCIQPYGRDSVSQFGETSDILATFDFGSHGQGVVRMETPNLSHLGNLDSFYTNSYVLRVELNATGQVMG